MTWSFLFTGAKQLLLLSCESTLTDSKQRDPRVLGRINRLVVRFVAVQMGETVHRPRGVQHEHVAGDGEEVGNDSALAPEERHNCCEEGESFENVLTKWNNRGRKQLKATKEMTC